MGSRKINRSTKRKGTKREEALKRQELRDKRTPQEQLEVLDNKLGVGVGAIKERYRLIKIIEEKLKKKRK